MEQWHYSRRMPTGRNTSYGLYADGLLYAVIVYGIGVNPYQAQSLGVGSTTEIKRMCRTEPPKNYPLSRLIAKTMKLQLRADPVDAVVAYADPMHGHEGTVYKASNFVHMGLTNPEYHVETLEGELRHRRYIHRYSERSGMTVGEVRSMLQVERIQTPGKHRWVYYAKAKKREAARQQSN